MSQLINLKRRRYLPLFLLLGLLLLPGTSFGVKQIKKSVTLDVKGATLESVIGIIKKQTGCFFIYDLNDISEVKNLNVKVTNEQIDVVLDRTLKGTGMKYSIDGNTVTVLRDISETKAPQKKESVKGVVLDNNRQPLPGVAIMLKGTQKGVVTDEKGLFEINVEDKTTSVLEFRFIGMKTKVLNVSAITNWNIVMEEDAAILEDVVVTGYYNANKATYTGSATTIKKADIQNISTTNLFTVLQSIDPSFKIVENNNAGSNPNSMPEFQIRGSNSVTTLRNQFEGDPNMPLFIVDGFEMGVEKVFDLDPLRIESVTLLKDASATAIYGSKAANGIVVLELIKPVQGQLRFDYSAKYIFTAPDLTSYDILNAREKLELELITGTVQRYSEEYNEKLKNVEKGYDTYWLNKPLKVSNDLNHNLSVSGGDKSLTYSLTATLNPSSGIMKGSGRDRYSVGSRLTYRYSNLIFSNSINYDNVHSVNSPYGSFTQYGRLNPYYNITDEDGKYLLMLQTGSSTAGSVSNPLWNTTLNEKNTNDYNLFSENFEIKWNVSPKLRLTGNGSINLRNGKIEQFFSSLHTMFGTSTDISKRGLYRSQNTKQVSMQGNFLISYSTNIKSNFITLNSGISYSDVDAEQDGFTAQGFVAEFLSYPSFANSYHDTEKPQGLSSKSRNAGVFLNSNYTYNNIYFLDVSVRADISSKFGKDSRWAPFWSIGAGYNIHREEFMKSVEFINQLKLRGSIGVTGSQSFDPYQSMSKYQYISDQFYGFYAVGALMMGMGNPNLKWQKTSKSNLGIDMAFLDNKLLITADIYQSKSKDLLTSIALAPSLGFSSYMENLGESQNSGYDFSIRGVLIKSKDMMLSISGNGSHNINKLTKISNTLVAWNEQVDKETSGAGTDVSKVYPKVRFIEGQSMSTIWVVRSLGIDPASGKEIYLDKDGNKTYVWSADDQVPFATSDPKLTGSLGLNFTWKGLTFNLTSRYSFGGKLYNQTLVDRVESVDYKFNCDKRVFSERWRNPGDITLFKDVKDKSATKPTSRFVQDNNYLEFSSINISYMFSKEKLAKLKYFKSLSLSFTTNDLHRFSSIQIERGLSYPFARSFNLSLQASF
ncbi:MAG: SusC/RagA family TonB-linked outer membrane protein [Bacteroidales bacterium]